MKRVTPNEQEFNRKIGLRIRTARVTAGITQSELAEYIGIAPQQLHKCESGLNRTSAARLFDIARVLRLPVNFFYSDLQTQDPVLNHFQQIRLYIAGSLVGLSFANLRIVKSIVDALPGSGGPTEAPQTGAGAST